MVNRKTGEIMVFQALEDIETALAIVEEELSGEDINPASALPRIKLPTGGMDQWTKPALYGNQLVDEIIGIPIFETKARTYWKKTYEESGGGQLPDCSSKDGKTGTGPALGRDDHAMQQFAFNHEGEALYHWECKTCPFAQWNTGKNGGKACKQVRMLAMLTPEELLPYILIATPGSIANMNGFIARLKANHIKPYHAILGLSLEMKHNTQQMTYAAIDPRLIGQVREEDRPSCNLLNSAWTPILKDLGIERDQVEGTEQGDFGYGHHTVMNPEDLDNTSDQDEGPEYIHPSDGEENDNPLPF